MPNRKTCEICSSLYTPTGRNQKYCGACLPKVQSIYNARKRAKRGCPVGVGKGGSNRRFTSDSQYRTGIGNFHRLRREMREGIARCERCSKDLSQATRYEWCVHHKDHDRTNNVRSNLEMLCKRCHQLEHECAKAFSV